MDPKKKNEEDSDIVHRTFHVETKAVDMDKRTVDVVMSTDDLDRYEERVVQNWKLESYAKNPVVLWAHNSRELPIGRCENVKIENGKLVGTIKFASEKANPKAEQCLQLFNEKVLNAVSVGFIPHSYRLTKEDDREVLELDDNELVELSATPTPANPEALVRMRAKAMEAKNILTIKAQPIPGPSSAMGITSTNQGFTVSPLPTFQTSFTDQSNKQKEIDMDFEKQIKELQEKMAAQALELAAIKAQAAKTAETLEATQKLLTAEQAKATALNERCATLETERAAQQKRADELASKAVEKELDELVGTKITPAEKAGLVKLSLVSQELFAEQMIAIKSRPDMKMLGLAVGTDPKPAQPLTTKANEDGSIHTGGDDLNAAIMKEINGVN